MASLCSPASMALHTPQTRVARSSTLKNPSLQYRPIGSRMLKNNLVKYERAPMVVKATGKDEDEDFEARLAALKKAKGETPYGTSANKESSVTEKPAAPVRDYTDETVYFESGPHMGDLAVNVALGTTLVWLPLSIASMGRAAFVKYRFTDRRISAITTAPWKNEQVDAAYEEVVDVKSIGRGVGLWGDMVVTLKDGSKVEMRAVPRYKEMEKYILERRDAMKSRSSSTSSSASSSSSSKGGFA